MNPALVILLSMLLCAVAGTVGYLLGRSHASRRLPAERVSSAPPADVSLRLRREIDSQVHQLRRARENAEPWRAPPVDRVHTAPPASAHTFADTIVEEDKPR